METQLGRPVQVEPAKPTVKAHGTKCLTLKFDICFQILLTISTCAATACVRDSVRAAAAAECVDRAQLPAAKGVHCGRAVQVETSSNPC